MGAAYATGCLVLVVDRNLNRQNSNVEIEDALEMNSGHKHHEGRMLASRTRVVCLICFEFDLSTRFCDSLRGCNDV